MEEQVVDSNAAELSIGSVFSRTWAVLVKRPFLFFGIGFILYAMPSIITIYGLPLISSDVKANTPLEFGFISIIFFFFVSLMFNAAVIYAAFGVIKNEHFSSGKIFARSLSRIGWLFLLSIIVCVCVSLGLLLLIVPGIILSIIFLLSSPVCIIERLGPISSMQRSASLTKGNRLIIFGICLLIAFVSIAIGFATLYISVTITYPIISVIITNLTSLLIGLFGVVMIAVIYCELRSIKESVPVESLTEIP